ncbi:MAG: hypothetical protein KF884_10630 [Fimbriimonadaceae bacterium]|nr:hypothetical protein [Fimbriimonadaceae bacterium]QYK58001.1 MAG: hypothetical protein KF884_10630 [Fimbriimonadaceae bacterium]
MAGVGAHEIAVAGPQPLLGQYGVFPVSNGTLSFELLARDGGTVYAGTAPLTGGAPARLVDVMAGASGIGASLGQAVGAVVSPSVDCHFNTGYTQSGLTVVAPSSSSLSVWSAGQVYEIGWVG